MSLVRYRERGGVVARTFGDPPDAEAAFRAVHDAGFGTEDVSIVVHDTGRAEVGATDAGVGVVEDPGTIMSEEHRGAGGVSVGTTGLIVPDVGVVIGGPLALAFAEGGAGGASGVLDAVLIGLGLPEDESRQLHERCRAGEVLVVVVGGAREAEARRVLDDRSTWGYRDELRAILPSDTNAASGI